MNLSSSAKLKEKASAISRDSKIKTETVTTLMPQHLHPPVRESVVEPKQKLEEPCARKKVEATNDVTPKSGFKPKPKT